MSTNTVRYEIVDGPAAYLVWEHAKYSQNEDVVIPVEFRSPTGSGSSFYVLKPRILGVMHEDGSGQSLLIEGYLNKKHFKGHYHARTRKGFIEIQ